jgi:HAD superfamily hydrolase (TIGR01509 family)
VRSLDSYRLAVVSSSDRSEVEPLLERAGIRQCFATLVCGREAARLKPAPDPYLLAARRLEAQCALAVEDSEAGTASALAAGLEVLTVTSHQEMPGQVLARLRTRR